MKGIAKTFNEILTQLQYLHLLGNIICLQNNWKCIIDTSDFRFLLAMQIKKRKHLQTHFILISLVHVHYKTEKISKNK